MYNFSFVNHDMISPCWGDTLRLNYNLASSQIASNASLFMTPKFDPSIMLDYPLFGTFGYGLLSPQMAVNQFWQTLGNNFNLGGNMGGFNFGNFQNIFQTNPWGNWTNGGGNNSNLSDAEREELAKVKDDVEFLKGLLKEVKTTAKDDIDRDTLRKIDLALSKSSNAKTELERKKEILTSLQDAYKSIDKDIIRKVTPTLVEVKGDLYESGFNFNSDSSYAYTPDKDQVDNTSDKVLAISSAINNIRSANRTCNEVSGIQKPEVLRIISAWNDTHNTDSERSIIRAINKQIKDISAVDEKKDVVTGVISPLTTALMQQTSSILNSNSKNFDTSVKEAVEKQIKDLSDALNKASNEANDTNLNDLADKFEAVYLSARKISAMSAQKAVANKYSFVDSIESGSEDDVFNDKLFKDSTVNDLEKEGFKGDDLKFDSFKLKKANTPADPKITPEFLKEKGSKVTLKNARGVTLRGDYYKYDNKYYHIENGKAKEITNVTETSTSTPTRANENNTNAQEPKKEDIVKDENKIKAQKNGEELAGKFYKYQGKIYMLDRDGNVKLAPEGVTEKA